MLNQVGLFNEDGGTENCTIKDSQNKAASTKELSEWERIRERIIIYLISCQHTSCLYQLNCKPIKVTIVTFRYHFNKELFP